MISQTLSLYTNTAAVRQYILIIWLNADWDRDRARALDAVIKKKENKFRRYILPPTTPKKEEYDLFV